MGVDILNTHKPSRQQLAAGASWHSIEAVNPQPGYSLTVDFVGIIQKDASSFRVYGEPLAHGVPLVFQARPPAC